MSFYKSNFAFSCNEILYDDAYRCKIAILKKDNDILEFFQFQEFRPLPEYRKSLENDLKTLGAKHLAFEVDNIESEFDR